MRQEPYLTGNLAVVVYYVRMQVAEAVGRPRVPDGVLMTRVIMVMIEAGGARINAEYLRRNVRGQGVRITESIRRLEQAGLIRRSRRGRLVLDPERLQDLLGDEVRVEVRR